MRRKETRIPSSGERESNKKVSLHSHHQVLGQRKNGRESFDKNYFDEREHEDDERRQ